jgi:hypothetical protein
MTWRSTKLLTTLMAGLLSWSLEADAHPRFKSHVGGFHSTQVTCDTMCTGGPLTGGLSGTLSWRMDSMEATSDPDVVKLVGVDTVTTSAGTLSGPDYTYWNLVTGDFIDVALIDHGTGAFQGVHGTLVIQGAFDPAAGQGTSNYVALLTLPN